MKRLLTRLSDTLKSNVSPGEIAYLRKITDINRARTAVYSGEPEFAVSLLDGLMRDERNLTILTNLRKAKLAIGTGHGNDEAEPLLRATVQHIAAIMGAPPAGVASSVG